MATYLQTHETVVSQGGSVRRNGAKPSGVVVIHTAENATDFEGYDGGAESVARFILIRTTYGCYHVLCDSDSRIQMAPWSWETWHDTGTNNHSVGISAAISCKDWNELADRGEAIVKQMARAAAEYAKWLKAERGISIPARLITREESRRHVPGFIAHGTSDPGRRSDPGAEFDWDLFFSEYKRCLEGSLVTVRAASVRPNRAAPAASRKHYRGKYPEAYVRAVQTRTKGMGYYDGRIDGDYGPLTTQAVADYQDAQLWGGLLVDGDWGPVTRDHHDWVERLQRTMNRWKGDNILVDGDYGSVTRARVFDLMRRNHGGAYRARIDGEPGPIFCRMLGIPVHP